MHELGIVIEIIKTVDEFAIKNGVTKIDTIVLQVGELSSVIPKYIEECYPVAIDGNERFQDTKLKIEILPGNALCSDCSKVFNLIKCRKVCSGCGSTKWELISGREFMIKEIIAC